MTDPKRLPDLVHAVQGLPRNAALIYRHFGAPDKQMMARRLRLLCFERDLQFLVGQDEELARECGADGLHLPERHLGRAKVLRARYPDWIITTAAHSEIALSRAAQAGLDAALLSPVFASDSPSAKTVLGVPQFSKWTKGANIPVYALGGINAVNVAELAGSGASGIAGISGFIS
jgi:thiamine-phosphate pyrophosphorylase